MLYRFTVMMFVSIGVVGGKLRFWSRRPHDLWYHIFPRRFCLLDANYCNPFYDRCSFGSLGEVIVNGGEFPPSF